MVSRIASYAARPTDEPAIVMDRGGVYRRPESPFWIIRFRYKGRLIREVSKFKSKPQAIAHLKLRMAEFGIGHGVAKVEIPTLEEASNGLLSHIAAAKKSGYAPVRSHLKSLLEYFGAETRIAQILPDHMESLIAARRGTEGLVGLQ